MVRRCAECGIAYTRRNDGALFHADELPKGVEHHAVVEGDYAEPDQGTAPGPAERSAAALEDIAESLRQIAGSVLSTR